MALACHSENGSTTARIAFLQSTYSVYAITTLYYLNTFRKHYMPSVWKRNELAIVYFKILFCIYPTFFGELLTLSIHILKLVHVLHNQYNKCCLESKYVCRVQGIENCCIDIVPNAMIQMQSIKVRSHWIARKVWIINKIFPHFTRENHWTYYHNLYIFSSEPGFLKPKHVCCKCWMEDNCCQWSKLIEKPLFQ